MQRHEQHRGVLVECLLRAVPVEEVPVDHHHAIHPCRLAQRLGRHRHVVHVTPANRTAALGVVTGRPHKGQPVAQFPSRHFCGELHDASRGRSHGKCAVVLAPVRLRIEARRNALSAAWEARERGRTGDGFGAARTLFRKLGRILVLRRRAVCDGVRLRVDRIQLLECGLSRLDAMAPLQDAPVVKVRVRALQALGAFSVHFARVRTRALVEENDAVVDDARLLRPCAEHTHRVARGCAQVRERRRRPQRGVVPVAVAKVRVVERAHLAVARRCGCAARRCRLAHSETKAAGEAHGHEVGGGRHLPWPCARVWLVCIASAHRLELLRRPAVRVTVSVRLRRVPVAGLPQHVRLARRLSERKVHRRRRRKVARALRPSHGRMKGRPALVVAHDSPPCTLR
eukprot:Opistho-1_new@79750